MQRKAQREDSISSGLADQRRLLEVIPDLNVKKVSTS